MMCRGCGEVGGSQREEGLRAPSVSEASPRPKPLGGVVSEGGVAPSRDLSHCHEIQISENTLWQLSLVGMKIIIVVSAILGRFSAKRDPGIPCNGPGAKKGVKCT